MKDFKLIEYFVDIDNPSLKRIYIYIITTQQGEL